MESPARQVKLSLSLIIMFSLSSGTYFAFALDYWNDGNAKYVWEGVMAVLFLGVALLAARNVSRLIH